MDQRAAFRRFTVILSLVTACVGLAILAPGRAQEGTPGDPFTLVVPAGDPMAFTMALVYANQYSEQNQGTFTIYLEGGTYGFEFPGSPQHPQLPSIRAQVVIQGNGSVLDLHLLNPLPHAEIAPLFILPTARLELHHLTVQIRGAGGRTVVNQGTVHLVDSVIFNGDPGIAEGGILNVGTLAVIRSTFEANQQRSATEGGGAILNRGSLVVSCSRFFDNQASQGGAIYNTLGGIAQVDHSQFRGNRANGGGGIFNADGITLEAGENFWGEGSDPPVDDLLMGTDTVSSRVQYAPALSTDPTQEAACQPPPPSSPPAPASSRMGLLSAPASVVPLPGMLRYPLSYTGCMETVGTGLPTAWTCLNQIMPDGTVSQITGLRLNSEPVWSPDGTRFAYQSWKTGRGELYLYDTLSQREITVTQNWSGTGEDIHPSWSPDGREILFDSSRYYGSYRDIYRVPADGSTPLNPVPLGFLDRATIKGHYPVFSPDGSMIAIAHNKDRSTIDTSTDVWLLRPNAYGEWRLSFRLTYHINSGQPISKIAWNTAGTQLYYAQVVSCPQAMCGPGITSTSQVRLLEGLDTAVYTGRFLADGAGFSRSPDGEQIAFLSYYDVDSLSYASSRFMYLMSADGSNIRKLQAEFNPGLGGVGFRYLTPPLTGIIVYASNVDGDYEIYTVPADNLSAAPTRITDNPANDHDPAISPDGRYLAFISDRDGQSKFYQQDLLDLASSPVALFDTHNSARNPAWSSDGRSIVFEAENTLHLYTIGIFPPWDIPAQGNADYAPTWKDAQTIAFLSRTDAPLAYRLCQLNIANLPQPTLFCNALPVRADSIAWQLNEPTPLGLIEVSVGQMILARINLTTSPTVIQLASVEDAEDLNLSPDGNFAAYTQNNTIYFVEVSGRPVLDASGLPVSIPNAVQPYWGVVYAPPTPTPTPTPPPVGLSDYGIELREDGRLWSATEKQVLLVGVKRVADAFTRFGVLGSTPPLRFKTVMGDWMVWLRLAETQPANSPYAIYYNTAAGECKVHDPIPSVINTLVVACRGFMRQTNTWITGGEVLETAVVHELGHIVDIRSGNQLRSFVGAPFMLPDCSIRGDRIMGASSGTGWLRGQRGWGSAIPLGDDKQSISQFQQNPDNSGIEAAADMFLNWVYRRTSDAAPSNLPSDFVPNAPSLAVQLAQLADACTYPSTGAWEGFQNINRTGNPDPTLPGNRRYWWMEGTLSVTFKSKGWQ